MPILANGVDSALTGQEGSPLVPVLRRAAQRMSSAKSLWAQQCPGPLPIEVAAIVHWACIDMQHAHALVRDIEFNRDRAMDGEPLPDPNSLLGESAQLAFHRTIEFHLEHRDLLGQVSVGETEMRALSRLLAYCALFKAIRFLEPTLENFYLIPSESAGWRGLWQGFWWCWRANVNFSCGTEMETRWKTPIPPTSQEENSTIWDLQPIEWLNFRGSGAKYPHGQRYTQIRITSANLCSADRRSRHRVRARTGCL